MAEAQVEVSFSDWYEDEDDETCPWCVDDGSSISVMRTREIYARIDQGRLSLETKVWRDGRACWLPISECYELTVRPAEPADAEVPEQSGVRRVPQPPRVVRPSRPPVNARDLRERTALLLLSSLLCGVFIGLLALWPYEPDTSRAQSGLADIAARFR